MSYDISFKVKVDGIDKWIDTGYCDANITWNVGKIIRLSTGLEWKNEENNGLCSEIIPKIIKGVTELEKNGENYRQYEPGNGWGTVEGTIRFFKSIVGAYGEMLLMEPELAAVATFWIE